MSLNEIIELRLKPALRECEQHLARLRYAAAKTKNRFPMDMTVYQELNDESITTLDQMLFRFGKLQDAMGQRLFPAILQAGQEWQERDTFLDKLNRLEKLGAIPSVTDWLMLRDLRNSAMHEYPDQPEINAANLNRIYTHIKLLEQVLIQANTFARERYLDA